jgi:hypothetical protein
VCFQLLLKFDSPDGTVEAAVLVEAYSFRFFISANEALSYRQSSAYAD